MDNRLHITNGDVANQVLEKHGIEGTFLAWADVMHEGPLPQGLSLQEMSLIRAGFIADRGWASQFEARTHFETRDTLFLGAARDGQVVIWNSWELYDQLHMLQLLHQYNTETAVGWSAPLLVFVDTHIGSADADYNFDKSLQAAKPATPRQFQLAEVVWQAVTSANPRALAAVLEEDLTVFPYLRGALQRFLQEYPSEQGICRTERQILEAVDDGENRPGAIFGLSQKAEEIAFMGDSSFWQFMRGLIHSDMPLLALRGGGEFILPGMFGPDEAFLAQRLELTEEGQQVLDGELDWLSKHQPDRWIGGVHLNPENLWRWTGECRFKRG
ncbi:hypothetical protein [Marinobacterium jannaschii]|uniref:hypothetical protein n=1 Tax=Marinobacterium jannaschii TaxID=64970 RepID=UPI0012EC483C|nr:hypothetical protein [Marinobacterium jannaschii]